MAYARPTARPQARRHGRRLDRAAAPGRHDGRVARPREQAPRPRAAARAPSLSATAAPPASVTSSPWLGPTAPTSACSQGLPASTSSSSTAGASPPLGWRELARDDRRADAAAVLHDPGGRGAPRPASQRGAELLIEEKGEQRVVLHFVPSRMGARRAHGTQDLESPSKPSAVVNRPRRNQCTWAVSLESSTAHHV